MVTGERKLAVNVLVAPVLTVQDFDNPTWRKSSSLQAGGKILLDAARNLPKTQLINFPLISLIKCSHGQMKVLIANSTVNDWGTLKAKANRYHEFVSITSLLIKKRS